MDNSRFKFRVWDKEEKHMHYIPAAELYEELFLRADGVLCNVDYSDRRPMNNRYEVSFSTGLHDCDGKEIFEGEYLALAVDNAIPFIEKHEVVFSGGCFIGKRFYAETNIFCANYMYLHVLVRDGYKVIGNRFENPELLAAK